jgi:hypothetical protein
VLTHHAHGYELVVRTEDRRQSGRWRNE